MTNPMNNPNEHRKLSDDELSKISGGSGSWAGYMEDSLRHAHQVQLERGLTEIQDFKTWLTNAKGVNEDIIKARDAWIAGGKDPNSVYAYIDGTVSKIR